MYKDIDITILCEKDIMLGSDTALNVLEETGLKTQPTDLAIITGEEFDYDMTRNYFEENTYWVEKDFLSNNSTATALYVDYKGNISLARNLEERMGVRPVLVFSSDLFDAIIKNKVYVSPGVDEVQFGWYPQIAPTEDIQDELENRFQDNSLKTTGNSYTFDSEPINSFNPFVPVSYPEYEYLNKRYIRVKVNSGFVDEFLFKLSNGVYYENDDYVWIEVKPITWLIDYDSKKLISRNVLVSGIMYNHKLNDKLYYEIVKYLKEYMLPDLTQEYKLSRQTKLEEKNVIKEINPYGLKFEKVSEEEIIRGAIESGVAVFLHGPSSEGKSARVKQIDPDCKIIYLRNASPDSLNGKSVYNSETGEMIDVKPSWLKQLEEKCESEPDKLHVVFFDEITNALPSIQGIAFNIVLDREVNGIWKLPENARIVASGNEMKDSLAANQLAEPLFNRFAHVYIKTTVESWLKWASENGIHPAIYTFVAYKRGEVLRSEYNGERPNADPRKWEMASKMLYATSNPEMIRSLVGEEITNEFVAFCKTKVITVEDVINDNYEKEDLRSLNTSERYATVMCLSQVSEEHIEKVRNFVSALGGEYRSIFDTLWIQNKPERLEIIAELSQEIDTCEVIEEDKFESDNTFDPFSMHDAVKLLEAVEKILRRY